MTTSNEMPKWPNEDDYISIEPPDGHEAGREDYERALRLAWEDVARKAVEALRDIAPDVVLLRRPVEWWENRALSALVSIGPIPPKDTP